MLAFRRKDTPSPSSGRRLRAATRIAALASTVGCGEILGASDYGVRPETSDAGGESIAATEPPILPAMPDEGHVDRCEACIEANCIDQRNVCLGSERCRAMLWCTTDCKDPSCLAQCEDTVPESAYFRAYFNCAFSTMSLALTSPEPITACLEECNAGQNWGCLGDFLWGSEPAAHPSVHVQLYGLFGSLGDPATFPGYEVTGCADGAEMFAPPGDLGCASPWTAVDTYGGTEIPFSGDGGRRATALAVRNTNVGVRERVYARPIVRDGLLNVAPTGGLGFLNYIDEFKMPHEDELGIIIAYQHDCLGVAGAAEIQLGEPGASVRRCPAGADVFQGTLTDCTTPGSGAFFTNVSPSSRISIMSHLPEPDGRPVSAQGNILAASHWYTTVHLYPLDSTGQ